MSHRAQTTNWHIMLDNLKIQTDESLARWMAQREGIAPEARRSKANAAFSSRWNAAFLYNPIHQVVFYYTRYPHFLDKSSGNLAQHSVAQTAQTQQFLLTERLTRPNLGVHRLLQIARWLNPSSGPTPGWFNHGVFSASVY